MNNKTSLIVISVLLLVLGLIAGYSFAKRGLPPTTVSLSPFPSSTPSPTTVSESCNPKPEDYPANETLTVTPHSVDFASYPAAKMFRTVISQAEQQGPNFAGHYTVATWGCGTGCQSAAIVNAKTGTIVWYHEPFRDNPELKDAESSLGFDYVHQTNSRLISVGPPNDADTKRFAASDPYSKNLKVHYYQMINDHLEFICKANYVQ